MDCEASVHRLVPDRGPEQLRCRFPALKRVINGHPLVYLDSAATTLRPDAVIDAGCHFCRMHDGNPHRGLHALSTEATEAFETARKSVARWIGAPSSDGLVFTRNATSAINLVARGLEHMIEPGDQIVLTEMEHHANLVPWQMLARRKRAHLRFIPITDDGKLDLTNLSELLNGRTKIVALTHVSNVLGTINPVAEIAAAARARGAFVLVDAAQSVGHMPVCFDELGADFLVFSAHKVYGPTGLGFLAGRPESLELLEPLEAGGEMIETVTYEESTWADIPHRFEAGTGNAAAVSSFPLAMRLINEVGLRSVQLHDRILVEYTLERLMSLGVRILGPLEASGRSGLISFVDDRVHPHDLATILNEEGIAIRAGHHCAQPLHRKLGIGSSARVSFGIYSTRADVDALIDGVEGARKVFRL